MASAESTPRQRALSHPPVHTDVHEPQHHQRQKNDAAKEDALACGLGRRTVGICLLLIVVILWTASNFLASVRFDAFWVFSLLSRICIGN